MAARSQQLGSGLPGAFAAALALGAGFLGFVAWDQSHWWRVREDYTFGWLVPLFVAFVIYDRWRKIRAALATCAAENSPRVAGWRRAVVWTAGAGVLLFGVLMFLLGAFYRAGAGTSQPGTLAITMGAAGILLPLLFINAPEPANGRRVAAGFSSDARVRVVALFLFPVLVWLISAPIVSAVETQLSLALRRHVVTIVAFAFDAAGIPIEQQGNVLALPNGTVGVEDACSGIRSLTGCLFAGAFLAAVFLDRGWKKIALVVLALALAFFSNIARSLFLTAWVYTHGPNSIEGTVHDVTGYGVLALTVVGLLCLLPLLNRGAAETDPSTAAAS